MARVECTPEQAVQWQDKFSDGYRTARGDITWGQEPRVELVPIPAEQPYETGAEYVARHVAQAWMIGYASAWRWEFGRRGRAAELVTV